jgi:undecaprenyl pyrophosphate phosphatase UppP
MPLLDLISALVLIAIIAWLVNTRLSSQGNVKWIVNVVMALMVVGIALWLINTYVPMAGSIKAILNVVVVAATCVGVLQAFGLWDGIVKLWTDLRYRISH